VDRTSTNFGLTVALIYWAWPQRPCTCPTASG